jgi:hypothetical protein
MWAAGPPKPIIPNLKKVQPLPLTFASHSNSSVVVLLSVAKLLLFLFNENPNFLFGAGFFILYLSDKI